LKLKIAHHPGRQHASVKFYSGPDAMHRAACGSIMMTIAEADALELLLRLGIEAKPDGVELEVEKD